jgi:hypothetical protein
VAERTQKELAEAIDLEVRRVVCFRCCACYAVGEVEGADGVYWKKDVHECAGAASLARHEGDESRGGCVERRGRARRVGASDGVQGVVPEEVGSGALEWG